MSAFAQCGLAIDAPHCADEHSPRPQGFTATRRRNQGERGVLPRAGHAVAGGPPKSTLGAGMQHRTRRAATIVAAATALIAASTVAAPALAAAKPTGSGVSFSSTPVTAAIVSHTTVTP